MEADTESLRSSAPQWSLAGDKQLLGVLQNIHERLVSRCQETNKRLGEMAAALDDASIDLQNVNNKFMALSNSQFIESRVYDDDVDVAAPVEPPKEPPKADPISEIEKIKIGLKVLEDMHEPLQILDSDSDSDSEEEISRMVLKPKDLYVDRPLPYIIGFFPWQSKWHAGLLPEDSDSESSVKREPWEREEYSESDTEISKPAKDQESISSTEDFGSEQVTSSPSIPTAPKSQASVANELARRLRGELPEPESLPEEEYAAPPLAVKKVYRPEKPAPSNIFLDEPPPLEQSYQSSDEDDIFAELRKNQPYAQSSKMQSSVTEDLFGDQKAGDDIFSDFREPPPPVNQKSTLFSEESEPELFAEQPPPLPREETTETNIKKPIGGVSLFGNKGTESIGAAILKRNQRQSSSDEDVSDDTSASQNDKQKDIFDHLFAKSEKEQSKIEKNVEKEVIKEPVKEIKVDKKVQAVKEVKVDNKIDLFSDNIFDDIDDIFTSNIPKVPIKTAEKNQKSLFDDEDDGLFANVAVAKSSNSVKDTKDSKKSIFDSDDDLFSDKVGKKDPSKSKGGKDKISELSTEASNIKKSIFDSDEELFADDNKNRNNISQIKKPEGNKHDNRQSVNKSSELTKSNAKPKSIFDDSDSDIFSDNAESKTRDISVNSVKEDKTYVDSKVIGKIEEHKGKHENEVVTPVFETKKPSLFDDEEEDLFKSDNAKKKTDEIITENPSALLSSKDASTLVKVLSEENLFSSAKEKKIDKSIFADDSEDELFSDKSKTIANQKHEMKPEEIKSKSILVDDDLLKENLLATSVTTKEGTLKNEIKEEIVEELRDDIKSEIKDEVITELKDDLLLNKSNEHTGKLEKGSKTSKTFEKDVLDDEYDILKTSSKEKITSIESTKKPDIFDDLGDDLFSNTPEHNEKNKNVNNETLKETKIPGETEQRSEDTDSISADNAMKINKPVIEKPPFVQEEAPIFDKPDIFSDIFTEPPKFEKPKEPKKSKNVNALFDDDSDDEALFFKKNDLTLDEKPEFESPTTESRLFGIFQDEPPALDVDFVQKPNVKSKENITAVSDTKSSILDDKYSSSISNDQLDSIITPTPTAADQKEIESLGSSDKGIHKPDHTTKKDSAKTDDAPKSIGKLKTMNFNINVNALLPGASPKKVKATEQLDGNTQTKTKSSEDIHVKNTQEVEPTMVKSISFEGKPESQVLDNKLSKERAKIQVKRRPSTRRARKEAVRKSGIDFGEDSTDNSSSIDDHPKAKVDRVPADENKNKADILHTRSNDEKVRSQSGETVVDVTNAGKEMRKSTENKELITDKEKDLFYTVDLDENIPDNSKETLNEPVTKDEFLNNESTANTEDVIAHDNAKPKFTTKTVYILNDEDIFNIEKPKKVLNIVDDDNPGISTLGKVYNEPKNTLITDSDDELFGSVTTKSKGNDSDSDLFKPKNKTTLINDDTLDSDDNLFKNKTGSNKINNVKHTDEKQFATKTDKKETSENIVNEKVNKPENVTKDVKKDKTSIFDLSDDEELFSSSKSKSSEAFKKDVKKVDVKASLFGDDDDDDLFGSSKKTVDVPPPVHPTRPKEVVPKSSEPVFEDPLSLFGGDD